jgi:hypothetical protein
VKNLLSSFLEIPDSFYEWVFRGIAQTGINTKEEAGEIYRQHYHPDKFALIFREYRISTMCGKIPPKFETYILGERNPIYSYGPQEFEIQATSLGKSKIFSGSKDECRNIILGKMNNTQFSTVVFGPIYLFENGIFLQDYSFLFV